MYIFQLLNVLLFRSNIEVIRPGVPECGRQLFTKNIGLLFGGPLSLRGTGAKHVASALASIFLLVEACESRTHQKRNFNNLQRSRWH